MNTKRTTLDPFRALIGVLEKRGNSDVLRAAANASGLTFDSSLSDAEIAAALEKLGWSIQDGDLVVRTPEVREVFFPKGSPWDAHLILQSLFAEATYERRSSFPV